MTEHNQPDWVKNDDNEVKAAVEISNNFSNELHQMQDSLFTDEAPIEVHPTEEATPSSNQQGEVPNTLEATPQSSVNTSINPEDSNSPNEEQTKPLDDKQIIQISPEVEEEKTNKSLNKQEYDDSENRIEVINNIHNLNPQLNAQPQPPSNVSLKQRIKNWYSSLEKRGGEAEAKEALIRFTRNVTVFVIGSFFVSTIAEFVDNLK